jgi:hypothetical protein
MVYMAPSTMARSLKVLESESLAELAIYGPDMVVHQAQQTERYAWRFLLFGCLWARGGGGMNQNRGGKCEMLLRWNEYRRRRVEVRAKGVQE